ncbi:ketopantoate hydroxymethyltransferase [Paenibacillus donghaensis]|uniref:ketopantoate hydroxymethyltransferase n=1 Tax=Paenibacillus donghaensis TaxID=414771 RepID=UPI001883E102|nr:ketopantoate hydroxymethyltransferase [Paenibacillus donghaensis]MBE9913370.1 ketopantoate hydroxymethyltransferase [Paenibacillus donghaensis]
MIEKSFLGDIATYTFNRIAKIVLNDTVEIKDFVIKEVTESTVGMQYIVPVKSTSLITKIDIKDSNNKLITSNNVYVPIYSDTLLLETINVREALKQNG